MTETIPAEVLSAMGNTLPYGDNETRCRDIAWALKAAEAMGFVMVPTDPSGGMNGPCQFCGGSTCPRAYDSRLNCFGMPQGVGVGPYDVHPWRGPIPPALVAEKERRDAALLADVLENGT